MRTMKIQQACLVLMVALLTGCAMLPQKVQWDNTDRAFAQRMEFANKQMQVRLQYSDWLLASRPEQRGQERQRLQGAADLESLVSLAMVDSHPAEPIVNRTAGLASLKQMLPELGLDAQAFLRSWIALGEALLTRDGPRDDQRQQIQQLHRQIDQLNRQIDQLTAIDDQLNQRKLDQTWEVSP